MRAILFFFIVLLFPFSLLSKEKTADSLKVLFAQAKTQQERVERCLNLDNYYRNYLFKDSIPLTRILFNEGVKSKNEYIIADALRKLVMSINRKVRVLTNDSVIHYLGLADEYLTGERKKSFITEVRLRHIRSVADWTDNESQTIKELTEMYTNSKTSQEDVYFQIERNYALGMAASLTMSEARAESYKNSSRYFDSLFDLIQKLPIEYGAELLFWVNDNIYLSYLNSKQKEKTVSFLEEMMDILKRYKETPNVRKDIYQNFEYVHSLYYMGIAHYPSFVGYEKGYECLKKADKMLRKRGDVLSLYFTYESFYEDVNDYKKAIAYKDSVIHSIGDRSSAVAQTVTSSLYKSQARCYASLHDYENAYERMEKYDALREKIVNEESTELRAEMDSRYDLNHLELEKERLISRNRQIGFFSISFVLLLSMAWGITQRIHVNRLKRMQKDLLDSNKEVLRQSEKAQESEKMKTAFVNSMCHEIRTPLNAINGFSNLLLDETIDAECKEEFPELIQQNTTLLTRLLNDLLEVSNLSSSVEELPMEQADIRSICMREMDELQLSEGKERIHYCLDVDNDDCHIRTNIPYLSQTIAHLLNNANKFTESGQITLSCHREEERFIIKVTDTGMGIPVDKQEWVFDRFTKLDDFKPGTGLGLYICRLIVNRLGGTITIDPAYTAGARFVLVFPTRK